MFFFGAKAAPPHLGLVTGIILLSLGPAHATEFTVKLDGSGDFPTIQTCADAARAGDSCLVYAGAYTEHVKTAAGGTADERRITFKARGIVTTQGFDLRHPYVTVEGFDITGYSLKYQGLITIHDQANDCHILNNVLRNGAADVYGIYFTVSSGLAASRCVVRGNVLSGLNGPFLTTAGDGHLFDSNVLEFQNSRDYIRLFGSNHVFRRNVFWRGSSGTGTGNHPDFVQNFGAEDMKSENHLFEENWIQDLPSQFAQLNSGDGVVFKGVLYDNVKNITFRRNVIANISMNANIAVPGVRFESNTFYRLAYELGGIGYGGSLTRGDASRGAVRGNVFLAGGSRSTAAGDSSGYYAVSGFVLSKEVIGVFVTSDATAQNGTTSGIFEDLKSNGYIDANGRILAKATNLSTSSQFVLNSQYSAYKASLYDVLNRTARLDSALLGSFSADFNFVAGAASAGFPAKRNDGCDPAKSYTLFNFCEPHGINGGDPRFRNLASPLGPDGIPFTLDDGLKPLPGSPLCGKGEGGTDIGAYSCDTNLVFAGVGPKPPSNLRIVD